MRVSQPFQMQALRLRAQPEENVSETKVVLEMTGKQETPQSEQESGEEAT